MQYMDIVHAVYGCKNHNVKLMTIMTMIVLLLNAQAPNQQMPSQMTGGNVLTGSPPTAGHLQGGQVGPTNQMLNAGGNQMGPAMGQNMGGPPMAGGQNVQMMGGGP